MNREHGLLNTYNNHGCRCGACRKANSDYERERRRALKWDRPGACEVCQSEEKLFWDHHHGTISHRGWLCRNCNSLIGKFKESPEIMERAISYLESHK